jgi:hypothetical protein
MKLVKSSKVLTATCALSLAMGVVGSVHAEHKGVAHGKGGKGPQLSIDIEVFCGYPTAKEYDMDGNEILDFGTNAAVRVTDVSADANDGNELEDPQVDAVHIMCHAAVKDSPGKPTLEVFSEKLFENPVNDFGVHNFECELGELPGGATEWKVTAVVTGEQLRRDVFDSCEAVAIQ